MRLKFKKFKSAIGNIEFELDLAPLGRLLQKPRGKAEMRPDLADGATVVGSGLMSSFLRVVRTG